MDDKVRSENRNSRYEDFEQSFETKWPRTTPMGDGLHWIYPRINIRIPFEETASRVRNKAGESQSLEVIKRIVNILSEDFASTDMRLLYCTVCTSFQYTNEELVEVPIPDEVQRKLIPWKTVDPDGDGEHKCSVSLMDTNLDSIEFASLLKAVLDETVWSVIIAPSSADWLIAPYWAGVDVVIRSKSQREKFAALTTK